MGRPCAVQSSDSRANHFDLSQHRQRSLVSIPSVAGQPPSAGGDGNQAVPYVPLSHPFVERLIGTVRRECLPHAVLATTDLEEKLLDFQHYYNEHRTLAGRQGQPPVPASTPIAHWQISIVIDGRSIVEACTKRRLPPNFSNSPPTRYVSYLTDRELRFST